ncbi:unnamed protein product (macronuclear) [Paramecium tetraurelia]|uniref:RRM domain-containing protein n=1 Tax=Paramecium tetraurelia TaxID=5888 RepID=A0BSM1_PARTE|nr:uncharacterized protein GSPATT00031770001 [Paramecium tetraurelia]CAK61538.1 unnamed protein product [Paramecium tetraurelia]|eukprot:XP_001428936.1 hypothetical protein (macronuclear) [Paramecium tetraurelia strain d4-2]
MLSRLCAQKFTTQIQGVPIKLLEAMKFDISKVSEERYKNIRTLTCYLQDRLHDSQLMDFVRDVELIKDKVHTNTLQLKSSIFRLFNQYQVLDLVPLALRIDLQELQPEHFYDDFDRIETEIKSEYNCFVQNRASLFQPQNKSLTDFIQFKRKYHRLRIEEDERVPAFTQIMDDGLINTLLPKQELESYDTNSKEVVMNQLILARNSRLMNKQIKQNNESELRTPLQLRQVESVEEIKETNQVCLYNLPYILDEKFKQECKEYFESRFGEIESIEYFEYSNFKKQIDQMTTINNQNENKDFYQSLDQLSSTKKLLERVKVNKNKKLYKSYAVINFKNKESKLNALYQDLRIFGIKFKDLQLRIDDADHKKLLYINNLSKFSIVKYLVEFLNMHLGIQFEPLDERIQLQNNIVCLILKDFKETQLAFNKLNDLTFSRFKMNVFHYPDGLKYMGNRIAEHFNSNIALLILEQNLSKLRFEMDENWKDVKFETESRDIVTKEPQYPISQEIHSTDMQQCIIEMIEDSYQEEEFQLELFGLVWDEEAQY